MVEKLNHTLKSILRKSCAKFGQQWDHFPSGVLWAYQKKNHESTKEKPSFLLFGIDLKSPTETALLPPQASECTDLTDYREELVLSLSTARELATKSIKATQTHHKKQYDKRAKVVDMRVGDWTFVHFPQDKTGKLSRPWRGPFRIISRDDPDGSVVEVYFPEEGPLQVHQRRVCSCPNALPIGFYWYSGTRKSSKRVPNDAQNEVSSDQSDTEPDSNSEDFVPAAGDTNVLKPNRVVLTKSSVLPLFLEGSD